jgi:hypothetical protein
MRDGEKEINLASQASGCLIFRSTVSTLGTPKAPYHLCLSDNAEQNRRPVEVVARGLLRSMHACDRV